MACEAVVFTIDIDWAHDDIIEDLIEFLGGHGVCATWFATHETKTLDKLLDKGHEVGIHPNFNPLFEETPELPGAMARLKALCELVPDATSIRSHSLARSTKLAAAFKEMGYTHESNIYLPFDQLELVAPWRGPEGLMQVPLHWEDDVYFCGNSPSPLEALDLSGVFVMDIHPIHFYVNTDSPDTYEQIKSHYGDPKILKQRRTDSDRGIRSVVEKFLKTANEKSVPFMTLNEIPVRS